MDLLTAVDPTSSSSSDPYHPSFFELAASSQLNSLLQPALRYILSVLAQRSPRYLLRVVNNFDELYHVIMLGVERHYLKTWSATFSENFYGLKRRARPALQTVRAQQGGGSTSKAIEKRERLTKSQIRMSLFFSVGMPYLATKLHDFWERNGGGIDELDDGLFGDGGGGGGGRARLVDETPLSRRQRLHRTFLRLFKSSYPYAGVLYQLWLLTYNVGYLFDKTPYWRPWFWLMRVDLRRMGGGDGPRRPLLPPSLPPLTHPLRLILTLLRLSPRLIFESLKYLLPLSIFFFKFLEWWYGADNPRRRRTTATSNGGTGSGAEEGESGLPLFGPPTVLSPHPRGILYTDKTEGYTKPKLVTVLAPSSKEDEEEQEGGEGGEEEDAPPPYQRRSERRLIHNSCPLCGATPINNPALLPTGYVFCYTCAHEYLQRYERCPVTLIKVHEGIEGLRKVLG